MLASAVVRDPKEQPLSPAVFVVVYFRFYRAFIFIAGCSVCQLNGTVVGQKPTVQDMFYQRLQGSRSKLYDWVSKRNI
jgi:hypothetical protein